MALSAKGKKIVSQISAENTKMGDIKKLAKEIKKDHDLALELWQTGSYHPRLLAVLVLDKKLLTQETIDELVNDMSKHEDKERNQLVDWFLANQLMKDKKLVALIETWENHPSAMLQRLFWYHQARLRWTGQTPPDNTEDLVNALEKNITKAEPVAQWAMNFCAGWIGVYDPQYRSRCIELGENAGLYKDEVVPKNCTPNYLPEFIRIEVAKRETT